MIDSNHLIKKRVIILPAYKGREEESALLYYTTSREN